MCELALVKHLGTLDLDVGAASQTAVSRGARARAQKRWRDAGQSRAGCGMKRRALETPAPAIVDEAELAHRHEWLTRWLQLTPAGEGVQLEHRGTLAQRVAHLEAELDRVGRRDEAERFLFPSQGSVHSVRFDIPISEPAELTALKELIEPPEPKPTHNSAPMSKMTLGERRSAHREATWPTT